MSIKSIRQGDKCYWIPDGDETRTDLTAVSIGRSDTRWDELGEEDQQWFESYAEHLDIARAL